MDGYRRGCVMRARAMFVMGLVGLTVVVVIAPARAASLPPNADPCAGLKGCTEVQTVDITGDGQVDRLAYQVLKRSKPYSDEYKYRLRVVVGLADGRRVSSTLGARGNAVGSYGAMPLDGVPGAEIVTYSSMRSSSGAQVLTWRNGRLVLEKGPWQWDGSLFEGWGVGSRAEKDPAHPTMVVCDWKVVDDSEPYPSEAVFVTYSWTGSQWSKGKKISAPYATSEDLPASCSTWDLPTPIQFSFH